MILSDGQGVFYVPDYDKYWYRAMALAELAREEADAVEALGFWFAAATAAAARCRHRGGDGGRQPRAGAVTPVDG